MCYTPQIVATESERISCKLTTVSFKVYNQFLTVTQISRLITTFDRESLLSLLQDGANTTDGRRKFATM